MPSRCLLRQEVQSLPWPLPGDLFVTWEEWLAPFVSVEHRKRAGRRVPSNTRDKGFQCSTTFSVVIVRFRYSLACKSNNEYLLRLYCIFLLRDLYILKFRYYTVKELIGQAIDSNSIIEKLRTSIRKNNPSITPWNVQN